MCSRDNHIPPRHTPIHQLTIKPAFDSLDPQNKLYAHHLSRAAWQGSRIVMRQVSPESPRIFDFIMNIYDACGGEWDSLVAGCGVTSEEVAAFLEYAATFLCNLGNFYGEGGQKFVPDLSAEALQKIARISPTAARTLEEIIDPLMSVPPFFLGLPSDIAQSGYYPGPERMTWDEIENIDEYMKAQGIDQRNTRVQKSIKNNKAHYHILQASVRGLYIGLPPSPWGPLDMVSFGSDHSEELIQICDSLETAQDYSGYEIKSRTLSGHRRYFRHADFDSFLASQESWVMDGCPRIETFLGFHRQGRDPAKVRAEWEAVIGIVDSDETSRLRRIVDKSSAIIGQLPWAVSDTDGWQSPFRPALARRPVVVCLNALAICGSTVFTATSLPRGKEAEYGFKTILHANRANRDPGLACHWLAPLDLEHLRRSAPIARSISRAVRELIGNGTGELFTEARGCHTSTVDPLTGRAISSYYTPKQTMESVFGRLAATVEACRTILISEYLMDSRDVLGVFGYCGTSEITSEDLLYTTYLNIAIDGIQALAYYDAKGQVWPESHHEAQAHFTILKYLIEYGSDVIKIIHNSTTSTMTANIDRTKILSHGKPALGDYLMHLHTMRCTADVKSCRDLYEPLSTVDGVYEEWREIVWARPTPRWKFVQANTFIKADGDVGVRVYDESNEGIIESWAERDIHLREEEKVAGDAQRRAGVRASVKSFVQKIVHRK